MKIFRVLAAAVVAPSLLLAGLAACGASPTGSAEPSPSAAEPDGFPMTITHAMGETTIETKPLRVVALDQTFVDAVLTLDTELVGYTTYRAIDEKLPDYLEPVLDQATEAVEVGVLEEPNLEKIAALKPDLILSIKVRHEAIYEQLSKIAPTVFSETSGALWEDNLRLTGQVLGKDDLAEKHIAAYDERVKTIGDSIKESRGGTMPTISIARFVGEPTVRLYVENSYSGVVMKELGFTRPEDQPTTDESIVVDVSQENIPDLDAEYIFVATWDDPAVSETKDQVTSNKLWASLKGEKHDVSDLVWMTSVGMQGAHSILDDVATMFDVDPASTLR